MKAGGQAADVSPLLNAAVTMIDLAQRAAEPDRRLLIASSTILLNEAGGLLMAPAADPEPTLPRASRPRLAKPVTARKPRAPRGSMKPAEQKASVPAPPAPSRGGTGTFVHDGRELGVTEMQLRFLQALQRAMPQPVDRAFLAGKVWIGGSRPEFFSTIFDQWRGKLDEGLRSLGLQLRAVRGVGIALQPLEEDNA